MKPTTLTALALILVGLWSAQRPADAVPAAAVVLPSPLLTAAVQPVQAVLAAAPDKTASSADGRQLAAFYRALAAVVSRDAGKTIKSAGQFRDLNRRAGLLMFQQAGLTGKYAGLAEAIDKVLADQVGLDNTAFDDARRARAVAACEAIAWACEGGGS